MAYQASKPGGGSSGQLFRSVRTHPTEDFPEEASRPRKKGNEDKAENKKERRFARTLAKHPDGVSSLPLKVQRQRAVVDQRLIDVHAAYVAVRVVAGVSVAALPLVHRQLHIVEVPTRHQLAPGRAANWRVDEEVHGVRALSARSLLALLEEPNPDASKNRATYGVEHELLRAREGRRPRREL